MEPKKQELPLKKLRCMRSVDRHWVGDGFPVRTLFAYPNLGSVLSPFLLLDYAGPMEFSPTDERRGVGEHPHRGLPKRQDGSLILSGRDERTPALAAPPARRPAECG